MGLEHAPPVVTALLVFFIALVFRSIAKSQGGRFIRRIAGIDAIEYAVARSVEEGRPVSFSTGITGVGPTLYACLGVLRAVARKVAQSRARIIVPQNTPEAMAMVEDTVREAYTSTGRIEHFDPRSVVFLSEEQFAFASGYMGLMHREKVGSAFLFGSFAAESLILAEAGQQVGAFQIASSVSPEQVPFFICTCDYTLIGEELFAASAYLSKNEVQLGTVAGQDLIKIFFMVLIALGVLLSTVIAVFPDLPVPSIEKLILGGNG